MVPRGTIVKWHDQPVTIPGIGPGWADTENGFQVWCSDWLRKRLMITGDERYDHWHHSANEREGGRAGLMAKLKGQQKGWPDFVNCGLQCVIELKLPGGKPSREQIDWLDYFKRLGWTAEICRNTQEFVAVVEALQPPL